MITPEMLVIIWIGILILSGALRILLGAARTKRDLSENYGLIDAVFGLGFIGIGILCWVIGP